VSPRLLARTGDASYSSARNSRQSAPNGVRL
jgi:hypothetical protein